MKNNVLSFKGTLDDPGMIPRTLLFVFDTLNDKLMSQCKYKPSEVAGLDVLNEDAIKREECTRKNILDTWWNENIQVHFERLTY